MSYRVKFSQVLDKYYSAEWTKEEAIDELVRYFNRHLTYKSPDHKKAVLNGFPDEETIKVADDWLIKAKQEVDKKGAKDADQ